MPHEVIMPALGMTQETGLIVAWLKRPGERVSAGDPLMEVETDKATMEVEAGADGWLADVRAGEGDNVPVGDVVAVISDTEAGSGAETAAESVSETGAETGAETGVETEPKAARAAPEGREVIMPALGMVQDSGTIVAWLKRPGDEIAEGDGLLEVETDKATMEVEADTAGFLAAVYAAAGDDVPVGQVIAVISASKPDAPVVHGEPPGKKSPPAKAPPDAPHTAADEPAPAAHRPVAAAAPPDAPIAGPTSSGGRALASPKARRLAAERGLDLGRLVEAGHPQPYHVADLDTLAALPAERAPSAPATPAASHRIEARLPSDGLDDFTTWLAQSGDRTPLGVVLAALATGAIRDADGSDRIALRLEHPGRAPDTLIDADLGAAASGDSGDPSPALIVRDLTGSRLTAIDSGAQEIPVLTVASFGHDCLVSLDYLPGTIDADTAVALIDGFAARLEDPLRHLF